MRPRYLDEPPISRLGISFGPLSFPTPRRFLHPERGPGSPRLLPMAANPQRVGAYDPPLDAGIRTAVECLAGAGIETFESCEGGAGHAYPEPTVRFHGSRAEGYRAVGVAMDNGLKVKELRRVWPLLDGELTGPYWEMTFTSPAG